MGFKGLEFLVFDQPPRVRILAWNFTSIHYDGRLKRKKTKIIYIYIENRVKTNKVSTIRQSG